jgi:hypothetical protein
MRDNLKYFQVNWVDGMKINKNLFIAQDDAAKDALNDVAALNLSPIKYGVLPPAAAGEETFNVNISLDNQNTVRATVLFCQAITSGGARINIPALGRAGQNDTDGAPSTSFSFANTSADTSFWVVLIVNPFQRQPAGSPDAGENPPRFPYALPAYAVQVINDTQYRQFAANPYALMIGKIQVSGNKISIEEDYIPPCISVSAHPDLLTFYTELDNFLAALEMRCSKIVQKIFKKNQQNDLSELVMFLCDRTMLYLGQSITNLRWNLLHESPANLFSTIAGLARIMKNTIDLRIGSGKEELMNYLSEWCDLKQGELETMLSNLANVRYDNNDINKNIQTITGFVKVTGKLFETLSNLEFIGKRKEAGFFVKEEQQSFSSGNTQQQKAKRKFFG